MSTNEHFLINGFKNLITRGALAQSYLFFGEAQDVAQKVSEAIIATLEGTDVRSAHIDSRIVDGHAQKTIGIEEARSIVAFLYTSPLKSARKTIVILGAEALTAEAQNALLKTVEEPPKEALMIICTKSIEGVIAPLSSRCEKWYVGGDAEKRENAVTEIAKNFVGGNAMERKKIIGALLKDEGDVENFIREILLVCMKDPEKYWRLMECVTDRFAKIAQYNTNKKLQLETLIDA